MDAEDLLAVIDAVVTEAVPVAASNEVKAWLDQEGIPWEEDGRNGGLLEDVDREIADADPSIVEKWKAPGPKNATVGWSRAGSGAARAWANANGWTLLRLIDGNWRRVDEQGIPFLE